MIIIRIFKGSVGFKNSKKSTAIAGQAAGIAMSEVIRILSWGENSMAIQDEKTGS